MLPQIIPAQTREQQTVGEGTLSVDLILQQLLHGLLFRYVQRCFTFTVHASYICTLADQIPAIKAREKKKRFHMIQKISAFPGDVF